MSAVEQLFRNARLVLPDAVVHGDLRIAGGTIADYAEAAAGPGEDFEGDYLIPGLVELHTDHLESHFAPRPKVLWDPVAAVQSHDAQIAASGITTVFDALRVGMDEDASLVAHEFRRLGDAVAAAQAEGRLRAEHFIHLRCEVSSEDVLDGFALFRDDSQVKLVSLMDHTPGQRQFTSLDTYRVYYQGKTGMSDAEFDRFLEERFARAGKWGDANRRAIAEMCREAGIVLASHDDATRAHVAEAVEHGITVAEFPTTMEAAEASRAAGLKILMGAPNVVRGGSHSGNVSARDLAERGLLDLLSSDYVPFSMLHGAFLLGSRVERLGLPQAIALVTRNPAEAAGLADRGTIAPGLRADLVRVRFAGSVPVVRGVWREGRRVA